MTHHVPVKQAVQMNMNTVATGGIKMTRDIPC